ncbi:MAG TPA: cupin domain-containing protein [Actinomycetota bacterium]|nr:cupin domain-containing protein [Actinomycetota bacterium]
MSNQKARVIRAGEADHHEDEGVHMWVGVSKATGSSELWFGRFASDRNVSIPPHYHSCDTAAYLVAGRAAFRIGDALDERLEMEPGDYVFVPAGVVHTEETIGDERAEFIIARDRRGGETTYLD